MAASNNQNQAHFCNLQEKSHQQKQPLRPKPQQDLQEENQKQYRKQRKSLSIGLITNLDLKSRKRNTDLAGKKQSSERSLKEIECRIEKDKRKKDRQTDCRTQVRRDKRKQTFPKQQLSVKIPDEFCQQNEKQIFAIEQFKAQTYVHLHSDTKIGLKKMEKKYRKAASILEINDSLVLKRVSGFKRLFYEIQIYNDTHRLLNLRKIIFFLVSLYFIICKMICRSSPYRIILILTISLNTVIFIMNQLDHGWNETDVTKIEQVIVYIYVADVVLKISSNGIILNKYGYLKSTINMLDFSLTILYIIYINSDRQLLDFSPIRLVTFLIDIGSFVPGLKTMLDALGRAMKYITEALIVVSLFIIYFAIIGISLFNGLINYRCLPQDGSQEGNWIFCRVSKCPEGYVCLKQSDGPNIPTSFNNILFASAQVLRIMTMDNWTYVMYFTLKTFSTFVWVYFLFIIFFGGFFGFNLVIAILKTFYSQVIKSQGKMIIKAQAFSVQDLKQKQQYSLISLLKQYLQKEITIINTKEVMPQSTAFPRALSGIKRFKILKTENRLVQFMMTLNFKCFLLPKYKNLFYDLNRIDQQFLAQYQFDDLMSKLFIGDDFTKFQPVPLTMPYFSLSEKEILISKQIQSECEAKSKAKKIATKFCYQLTAQSKTYSQPKRSYPYKRSTRQFQLNDIPLGAQNINQSQMTYISNPDTQTISGQLKQVSIKLYQKQSNFVIRKDDEVFIRVHGIYLNHKNVLEKLLTKIPKKLVEVQNYYNEYDRILLTDEQQQMVSIYNYSGANVLLAYNKHNQIKRQLNHLDKVIWLTGLLGKLMIVRKYICLLQNQTFWLLFMDFIIFLNYVFLVLTGIISKETISNFEDFSTVFLTIELSFQIIDRKSKFFNNNWSIVEALIVLVNMIELAFQNITSLSLITQRLIRASKVLLFFRCLKYNKVAMLIGKIAQKTFEQYFYLTILMFISILAYGLIGMQVYKNKFTQTQASGQHHTYDHPVSAWMTVFNIVSNDWFGVLALGSTINLQFAMIYSISLVFFINYLIYGLVISIILDGYGEFFTESEEQQPNLNRSQTLSINEDNRIGSISVEKEFDENEKRHLRPNILSLQNSKSYDPYQVISNYIQNLIKNQEISKKQIFQQIQCPHSLFYFSKSNKIRVICCLLQRNKKFQFLFDFMIISSVTVFAIQTYYEDSPSWILAILFSCNLIMTIQKIVEIIALGFFLDRGSYLQYTWQLFDICYLIAFYFDFFGLSSVHLKLFLYFRFFRPMTLLYRISAFNQTYMALINSMSNTLNIFITILAFWTMFAVFGMIIYQNQFGFCEEKIAFDVSKNECLKQNKTWITFKHNFDNITSSLPTLFIISTFDGWGEILQVASNSQPEDYGPSLLANQPATYIFMVLFCFFGSMFLVSLFTSLLFLALKKNEQKLEYQGLNENQSEFLIISKMILKERINFSSPPADRFRVVAYQISNAAWAANIFFISILIDTICQLIYHTDISWEHASRLNLVYQFNTILLLIWVLTQALAFGINRYFDDFWRIYQFIILIHSLVDFCMHLQFDIYRLFYESNVFTQNFQLIRIFIALRAFRVLMLFQGLKGLQRLVRVMGFVVPFLCRLLFILTMFTISSALLGHEFYGHIDKGEIIDEQLNFKTFTSSLLTLFKCISGDNFRTIMTDTMMYNPYCKDDSKYCGSQYSQIYFLGFVLVSNYVLTDLFVLGLIEQFEKFYSLKNMSIIQTYIEQIDKIKTVWCKYSSEQLGKAMHYKKICKFLLELGEPFIQKDENLWDCAKLAGFYKVQINEKGYIQFNQLLFELFRQRFKTLIKSDVSAEANMIMKRLCRETQLGLYFMRSSKKEKRKPVYKHMRIDRNFSILNDYFSILVMFKTWQDYTRQLLIRSVHDEKNFTERSSNIVQNDVWDIFSEYNEDQSLSRSSRSETPQVSIRKHMQTLDSRELLDVLPIYAERKSKPRHIIPVYENESDVPEVSSLDGRPNQIYDE